MLEKRSAKKVLSHNCEWQRNKAGEIVYNVACPECGVMLWRRWRDRVRLCQPCSHKAKARKISGERGVRWNGGRFVTSGGYVLIYLDKTSPFFSMASHRHDNKYTEPIGRYIQEHRLVIAQHLGRCLKSWEVVHHINRDKTDNRLENLELLPAQTTHLVRTFKDSYIKKLEVRISKLETEVKVLKWHIKQYNSCDKEQDNEIVQADGKSSGNLSSCGSCGYVCCENDGLKD